MTLFAVPFNRHLGFELVSRDEHAAVLQTAIQPWFEQEGGIVHGSVITALADTTAVYAIGAGSLTGVEFKVNFLRPVRMHGGIMSARARVVRRGKRLAVCSVDVMQNDEVAATGLFTFLLG